MPQPSSPPNAALSAYGLQGCAVEPLAGGLINASWCLRRGNERFILQRMHPVFAPEVQLDFAAIGAHLRAAGLRAAELLPTLAGALWVELGQPGSEERALYRLQSHLPGRSFAAADASRAAAAARLLARLHGALRSFDAPLRGARPLAHDTAGHLRALQAALTHRPRHPADAQIRPVAQQILTAAQKLPSLREAPLRVVHGDPKISNFLFAAEGGHEATEALAMVDFDTFNRLPLAIELGDAWRSWCNPLPEDDPHGGVDLSILRAAAEGYCVGLQQPLVAAERAALPICTEVIALELAARFARDALQETYFGWDSLRFSAAWEHQLLRARGQASLAASHAAQRPAIAAMLEVLF